MNCWIVNVTEPIPQLDEGARPFRCSYLAKALNARGHSVVWWTSTFRHYTKDFREHTPREAGDLLSFRLLSGPGYKWNRSARRLIHHEMEAIRFCMFASGSSVGTPDLVFTTLPTLSLAAVSPKLAEYFQRPFIIDVNDCWPDHYLSALPPLLRPFGKPFLSYEYQHLRRSLKNASAVTAISKTYLNWAHSNADERNTNRDRVFPIGCHSPQHRPTQQILFSDILTRCGLTPNDFIILFPGTFGPAFDFQTVFRAAQLLHQSGRKNVQFVFAGAGPAENQIRREASNRPNIKVLGWIQNHDILQQVVASAHVGLCPYKDGASMSLPNKPFEFMAAGKPLLSSLRGELWEIIEREKIGQNYKASDAVSLTESIAALTSDPNRLQRMGRQSRLLFEDSFDADLIYSRFTDFLEHVAAEGGDPAGGKSVSNAD